MFVHLVNKNIFLITLLTLGLGGYFNFSHAQNLSDITLTITFENAPLEYNVVKAPLKYNKKFALSMQVDDGNESIYSMGFPVFEGGEVSGTAYPGMSFSDGCGNVQSFKMTSAIYMFSGVGTDVHNDPESIFITWERLDTLYNHRWGIANKGVNTENSGNTEFMKYSISRNQSYCRRKLYNTTPGGVIPTIFVNPGGNMTWSQHAFSLGSIGAFNSDNNGPLGDFGGNVNNPDFNWAQFKYNLFRVNPGNQDITDLVDMLNSQSVDGANYWAPIYTGSLSSDYVFSKFVTDFNYINNTYGSSGTDEILMTTDEEILNYLMVRDAITIDSSLVNNELTLTFSGDLPNNLLYYASSIVINSNEIITNVIIEGTDDFTFSNVGDTTALINISWNGYVVPSAETLATSYTSTAVATQTENDALIAMDYVTVLEYGDTKNDLVNQLCAIPGLTYDEGFCSSGYPNFVNISGDSIILTGQEALLQATDFMESYAWSNGQTTQSIRVSPQSDTKYWVDAITAYGDNVSDTILITVSDSYIISNSPLLVSHTLGTTDSLWVSLKEGASSLWSTGSNLNYILVNPNITTAYHLDVIVDSNIVNHLDFVVYIDNIIEFTFNSVCFGDTTTLINTSVVNDSIIKVLWDLNGNTQFDDAEGDTVKYVFNEAGNHLVGMRVYFKTDPMDIVYNAVPVGDFPNVDFKYENTCENSQTIFTDLSTVHVGTLVRWFWRFGDGKIDDIQNTSNYYTAPGNYNVMLIAWSSYGCKDSLQKTVQITSAPNLTLKTNYDNVVNNNDTVYFQEGETVTISVSNYASYDSVVWFNNDHAEFIIIAEEGSYYIDAYQNGCSTRQNFFTSWGSSPPKPPVGNAIMNLFTPNGDGFNDFWVVNDPKILPPTKVNVYNRSGKLIYSHTNYRNTWNGQYEGNPLPQATYYYIIEDASGQIFKGAVTIIR